MQSEVVPSGVLHIIPVGEDVNAIAVGLRHYPATAFAFLAIPDHMELAESCVERFAVLGVPISVHRIEGNPLAGMFHLFERILRENSESNVVVNVGAAGKHVACAAISACFVNGLNAFHVLDDVLVPLPIMRFSYRDQLGQTKKHILESLSSRGGVARDLNDLVEWTGLSKSLLSYHLRGNEDSVGLEELGFLNLIRSKQGRLMAELSPMGELVLIGRSNH